jgi:hypothetical protein
LEGLVEQNFAWRGAKKKANIRKFMDQFTYILGGLLEKFVA